MKVFITGVSSGIGKGLAGHYLQQGATVYGCSRRELPSELQGVNHMSFDLTDREALNRAILANFHAGETLDLLILNAGMLGRFERMENLGREELNEVFEINFWSQKQLVDLLLARVSLKQVVAISSGAAVNGNGGWGGYSLSKATLNMMIKLYASENPDICWSSLAPGLVDTAMQEYITEKVSAAVFPSVERLQKARGTEAMPKPDEIAPRLAEAIELLKSQENGGFFDLRKMDF